MQDFLEDNCAYGHFNYDKKDGKLIVEKFAGSPDKKFTLTSAVQKYVLAGGTSNYKTSTETDLPIARTLMKMMTQHHRAGVDNYITVQKIRLCFDNYLIERLYVLWAIQTHSRLQYLLCRR